MPLDDPLIPRQWHLAAVNAPAAWETHTGAGVLVGVVDDGVDSRHPDLDDNYDPTPAFNYRDQRSDGDPVRSGDNHGTAVAGLIGAVGDNGVGGAGVAHGASISSLLMLPAAREKLVFQNATNIDILNNSWGLADPTPFTTNFLDGGFFGDVGDALANLTATGRGGLGTVVVFAGGNERQEGDRVDYDNLLNSRFTIAVGASDRAGEIAIYSDPGAALLVTAPGGNSDIVTTDRVGTEGRTDGDYRFDFGGTSASAPIVSGVIALMLEANPLLGYRDVQEILAYSARESGVSDWTANGATTWNGGGLRISHDFGFGIVDALAAVRLAESWSAQSTKANEESVTERTDFGQGVAIQDLNELAVTLDMPALDIDHVEVTLDFEHSQPADLTISLTSPAGTVSILADQPGSGGEERRTFRFDSVRHWGEDQAGEWTLKISDEAALDSGTLYSWELALHGDPVSNDDLYVFTDAFAQVAGAERRTLTDDGGDDTLNATAVTGGLDLDLRAGAVSTIAGQQLEIAAGTVIENALGGSGDDALVGNGRVNLLRGGRGSDLLEGRGGADELRGGRDQDELRGGSEADTLHGGRGADLLVGGTGVDTVRGGLGADLLVGGNGADMIHGGAGGDLVVGGRGSDLLTGGRGRDRFRYDDEGDAGDTIVDFTIGVAGDQLVIADLLEARLGGRIGAEPADLVGLDATADGTRVTLAGSGGAPLTLVTLQGVTGVTLESLLASDNLVVA